ncbi:MAG TPA: hypothetical protein VN253_10235 [Kofleriaceae bacterium]|nr:hypothetical protein [Kofleriaceae bacterium]
MLQHEQEHNQRKHETSEVANDHEAQAAVEQHAAPRTAPPAASFEELTGQPAVETTPAKPKAEATPQVDSNAVSDVFVEQVAHGMAYKDALDDADEKYLAENGYSANPALRGANEFFMRTFTPTRAGKPPIVAFRGTVPTKVDTLVADVDPSGIGMYQFNPNKQQIERQMQAMASHGKVISAGHSLGGALAQIAAATFPGLVDRIVTFQAPGVSREMVQKLVQYNEQHPDQAIESSHHRVKNDLVPMGGQALTPGVLHNHEMVGGSMFSRNPLAAHTSYPLAREEAAQGNQLPNAGVEGQGMRPVGDSSVEQDNADKSQLIEMARTGLGHLIFGAGAVINGVKNAVGSVFQ